MKRLPKDLVICELYLARIAKGWSQENTALRAGFAQTQISDWENEATTPRYANLKVWAETLDVTVAVLPRGHVMAR